MLRARSRPGGGSIRHHSCHHTSAPGPLWPVPARAAPPAAAKGHPSEYLAAMVPAVRFCSFAHFSVIYYGTTKWRNKLRRRLCMISAMNPAVPVEIVKADAVRLLLGTIFSACGAAACLLWLPEPGGKARHCSILVLPH